MDQRKIRRVRRPQEVDGALPVQDHILSPIQATTAEVGGEEELSTVVAQLRDVSVCRPIEALLEGIPGREILRGAATCDNQVSRGVDGDRVRRLVQASTQVSRKDKGRSR